MTRNTLVHSECLLDEQILHRPLDRKANVKRADFQRRSNSQEAAVGTESKKILRAPRDGVV
jgi:hypothetical protein